MRRYRLALLASRRDESGFVLVAVGLIIGLALLVLVAMLGLLVLLLGAAGASEGDKAAAPTQAALDDIPPELLGVYQKAAAETCGMPWGVLAAVGDIESDHGRSELPGVKTGSNYAGAQGPMQFMPPTWAAYGRDGDGDGIADVYNPVDAIWGAAAYLCASGAGEPDRLRDALWAYNHDWGYVEDVLRRADEYASGPGIAGSDASAVLNNPNIALCAPCRQDIANGIIEQSVIDLLAWAAERHHVAVSVLKTGHAKYVAGTDRISNHWEGRGADLYAIDGISVSPSCGPCRQLAEEIVVLGDGRPDEMGVPWYDMAGAGGWNVFADRAHQNHLHVGWRTNPPELH